MIIETIEGYQMIYIFHKLIQINYLEIVKTNYL